MALRKGQQRSKEYLFMNPLGKVPCLKVSILQPTTCQANSRTRVAPFQPC